MYIHSTQLIARLQQLDILHDGTFLASGSWVGNQRLLHVEELTNERGYEVAVQPLPLSFEHDEHTLAYMGAGETIRFGVWTDTVDNKTYVDIVANIGDRGTALMLAKKFDQKAIWSWAEGEIRCDAPAVETI